MSWEESRPCPPCRDCFEVEIMLRIIDHIAWNFDAKARALLDKEGAS